MLSPFLEVVMEALEAKYISKDDSKILLEKIIENIPAEDSTSNLFSHWNQASNDQELEFDNLLDLQYVITQFEHSQIILGLFNTSTASGRQRTC